MNTFIGAGKHHVVNISDLRHVERVDEAVVTRKDLAHIANGDPVDESRIRCWIDTFYKNVRDPVKINFGEDRTGRDAAFERIKVGMDIH